jgi:predicted transcriptional regulator
MSRLKACFDKAKELLGIVGEWYNVRGFRNAITSRLACKTIPLGYMERLYMHYHQAIKCIWNLLCVKCGIAVAEEFKRVALFALFDDMEDYQQKLDEIKEERRMESKDKAPRREAAKTAPREVVEEVVAEHAEQIDNKGGAKSDNREVAIERKGIRERREKVLDLLRNNPALTIDKLVAETGYSKRSISRYTDYLESTGRLRRVGDTFTGHWEVTEEM